MKGARLALAFAASCVFLGCSTPEAVPTKKIPREFVEFGQTRIDDYYWLNNPSDPAVLEHLRQENAYTDAMLRHTAPLQAAIYDELVARMEQTYTSLPIRRNGYWYYVRYREGEQYPLYCRKRGDLSAPEEVYLDIPQMAGGHQIFILRGYAVSPDNALVAYGIDTTGDRRCALYVKDLRTGTVLEEGIGNTSGSYAWGSDSRSLLYVLNDPTVRAYRVMRHSLGGDPAGDTELFAEGDSTFSADLSTTKDRAYILIASGSTLSSEWRFLPADRPAATPTVLQPRRPDLLYEVVSHERGSFIIRTNHEARNFRLVRAPVRSPGLSSWHEIVPHRTDALLESAEVLKQYLVVQQRVNGLSQIVAMNRSTGTSAMVRFDEEAYVATLATATDAYDLDSIRYIYTSLTTPLSTYRYDLATGSASLLKRDSVGGRYDASLYTTRRLWARSADSVRVPISVVYKTSLLRQDGSNPLLLYAYGSYGASSDPGFSPAVISLLDRGFVYGIAHIRGGQELGRQWYEDGKVLKKKNSFHDYVACAEHLVNERFTSPGRLFANGGSAGGMLMGAVINLRPDLFRGVLAEVPWMDVITDMKNTDLPLTTLEFDEWGNPAIREQYDYMHSWSPYDNVVDAVYPAIFATGGLNDTQVPYFSPAKWVAKVREHNTGSNPILFRVNMGAGHSGESGRFERQKLTAEKYAFILDLAGIHE